jgi:hypothetical protein
MFGHRFYNETTRRYVAVFGTLFNDIVIYRKDNNGDTIQTIKVPVSYGPIQKFLSKIEQDPSLTAPAITLPRISFEITGMTYDGERKLTNTIRNSVTNSNDAATFVSQFSPAPYNLEFQLNIMTKYAEDGTKIIEQIIPFFKPEQTLTVRLIDELNLYLDIPVILNNITTEDVYEGDYETRRSLIWTLSFTLKGYYFGPKTDKKIIKFVETNTYGTMDKSKLPQTLNVYPGMTADGTPTTDASQSVDWSQIDFEDDWAFIVEYE